MALKTLIFGVGELYPALAPYYEREVERGNLDIATYSVFENGGIHLVDPKNQLGGARIR